MRNSKKTSILAAAVGVVAFGTVAQAASLVTFSAKPISPGLPEFVFTNDPIPLFQAGPGATGNADGNLSDSLQSPGGLGIQTPLNILTPPGSGSTPLLAGGTAFDDVTFVLHDLAANGPASDPGTGVITQGLGKPTPSSPVPSFQLFSTDPDGPGPLQRILLLEGTITKGAITALDGEDTASVLSAKVNYTDGLIYDALIAAGGTPTGSLSWSLLDILNDASLPSVTIDPGTGYFIPFHANATGLFSTPAIPEPTSAAIAGVSALAMLVRRRRSVR